MRNKSLAARPKRTVSSVETTRLEAGLIRESNRGIGPRTQRSIAPFPSHELGFLLARREIRPPHTLARTASPSPIRRRRPPPAPPFDIHCVLHNQYCLNTFYRELFEFHQMPYALLKGRDLFLLTSTTRRCTYIIYIKQINLGIS